jgi:hypothetical protein
LSRPGSQITPNPLILAAGILLMVSGMVWVVTYLGILGATPGVAEVLYLLVGLVVAALSINAGWLVLWRQGRGRSLGLVLAIIGFVLALISLIAGGGVLIINLLINAFLIYVLTTQAKEFA